MQSGRGFGVDFFQRQSGRWTCPLHPPRAVPTSAAKAAQRGTVTQKQADSDSLSDASSKPTTSGGWRKLRRGEAWDYKPQSTILSSKDAPSSDRTQSGRVPVKDRLRSSKAPASSADSSDEEDIGPRKSLFVQGINKRREADKVAASKAQQGAQKARRHTSSNSREPYNPRSTSSETGLSTSGSDHSSRDGTVRSNEGASTRHRSPVRGNKAGRNAMNRYQSEAGSGREDSLSREQNPTYNGLRSTEQTTRRREDHGGGFQRESSQFFPPLIRGGQSQDLDSEFAERRRAGWDGAGSSGRIFDGSSDQESNSGRSSPGQGSARHSTTYRDDDDDLGWNPPSSESTIPRQVELPQFAIPITRREGGSTATFFTRESFQEAGASEEVIASLAKINIQRPSFIQAAAYKTMMKEGSGHVVIADHAGSGKTLAYLLPLVQQLREAEKRGARTMPNRPRVVVILPTTELCMQVLRVARAVSLGGARFKSIGVTGGYKLKTQKDSLREGADMVIGTPGRLFEHLKAGSLQLDECQAVVLDEVDILLGETSAFMEQLAPIRDATPPAARFVLVTASLPEPTWLNLQQQFYGIQPVLGPGLHRPAPGSLEQLVDCSGGEEINEETGFERKSVALLQLLKEHLTPRTIVFCNKIHTCRKVENVIRRAAKDAMDVLPYHTAIEDGQRSRNLKTFLSEPLDGTRMVLVCTDQASRGVDTAHVQHVILFDFPRDPSEYVRRAGRTARGAGGSGTVSLLVLGRQVRLAKQILERNDKGLPLHRVPIA